MASTITPLDASFGATVADIKIPEMDDTKAQALLDELLDFSVQSGRTYAHSWQPGDTMNWHNRCLLHRACPYDYSEPRVMRHVRVAGQPDSDLVETVPDERADDFEPLPQGHA